MLKFAANITWLYREWPFLERPLKAAEDGFDGIECLFPYHFPADDLAESLGQSRMPLALINAPAGDWEQGERGLAGLPGREVEFAQSLEQAWHYASILGCSQVHVMAGLQQPSLTRESQLECLIKRLKHACDQANRLGITVMIEALNAQDVPNYLVPNLTTALSIHEQVDRPNLKIQFDLYHQQRTDGDLSQNLARLGSALGHIQCAGVPGRHEPDYGEIDFGYIFQQLTRLNYSGWIGAEYSPRQRTRDGLNWLSAAKKLRPALYSRLRGIHTQGSLNQDYLSTENNNE
ncbi:MAG: TIM barrel protein [Saccharospirillum sp.]|nr:TIM barrel protein [Saccharospirillum sp.]